MSKLCVVCRGAKMLCGRQYCPLLDKVARLGDMKQRFSGRELFGETPSVFVGRIGYPNVYVGPLLSQDVDASLFLDTARLREKALGDLVDLRTSLFRGKYLVNVKSRQNVVYTLQDLSLAKNPVDTEVWLSKTPLLKASFDSVTEPMGASAEINKVKPTENIKIARKVDKIVSDEMLSQESMKLLYETGLDVPRVSNILSSGTLGLTENKKMVPTRWSITAVDDTLGKQKIEEIKCHEPMDFYSVFESKVQGNRFLVLLMPRKWSFEQLEAYLPGCVWLPQGQVEWIQDHEDYYGRTKYASEVAGAYYAARLSICEHLGRIRRQAAAIVVREIEPEYVVPLGVWVIREGVRKALEQKMQCFVSLREALDHMKTRLVSGKSWEKQSQLLKNVYSSEVLLSYMRT